MAQKFGLGRGLADIKAEMGNIPDISILRGTDRVAVRQIPLVQIGVNPDQPRKTFDPAQLDDLASSIRAQGVLQPILLRAVVGRDYQYEIVAGERRYRASKMAGCNEIPALVKELTPENAMEIALIENVQRENLNPIEEGAAYKNIMDKCGYSLDDVSRLIGKSVSYIRNIMRLDALPDTVKDMVESGRISASHARTIAVAENPTELANEIIEKKLTVADTQARVHRTQRASGARAHRNDDTDNDEMWTTLDKSARQFFDSDIKILRRRNGAGEIHIRFHSRHEMEKIIEKLSS